MKFIEMHLKKIILQLSLQRESAQIILSELIFNMFYEFS